MEVKRKRLTNKPVRTLDDLRSRCEVCEDTGCWEWLGHMGNKGKTPVLRYLGHQASARAVARLLSGRPVCEGYRTLPGKQCSAQCINPQHTRHLKPEHFIRATILRGGKQSPNHLAAVVAGNRRRCATSLIRTVAVADSIRRRVAAGECRQALADEFKCTRANINHIVRGTVWRSAQVPVSSIFAMAAAA